MVGCAGHRASVITVDNQSPPIIDVTVDWRRGVAVVGVDNVILS
jgi:hypothetical protein